MLIETFVTSAFQQNTRVVVCEKTSHAICIDPGGSAELIAEFIKSKSFNLQAIALTHAHLDHIGGVSDLHEFFPEAEIILHQQDEDLYYGLPEQPLIMGIPRIALASLGLDFARPPKLTRNWHEGEIYQIGGHRFKILHTPGHTRGHVVFLEETQRKIFVGDCLFAGSIGRTDLPGGSFEQLMGSINEKILTVGDDVVVYSGHGPETTIGEEKRANPFLTGAYKTSRGNFI
jgi:glyoxylase-like metal-dependent hydrolase (beta-lactamase superfamily II)